MDSQSQKSEGGGAFIQAGAFIWQNTVNYTVWVFRSLEKRYLLDITDRVMVFSFYVILNISESILALLVVA